MPSASPSNAASATTSTKSSDDDQAQRMRDILKQTAERRRNSGQQRSASTDSRTSNPSGDPISTAHNNAPADPAQPTTHSSSHSRSNSAYPPLTPASVIAQPVAPQPAPKQAAQLSDEEFARQLQSEEEEQYKRDMEMAQRLQAEEDQQQPQASSVNTGSSEYDAQTGEYIPTARPQQTSQLIGGDDDDEYDPYASLRPSNRSNNNNSRSTQQQAPPQPQLQRHISEDEQRDIQQQIAATISRGFGAIPSMGGPRATTPPRSETQFRRTAGGFEILHSSSSSSATAPQFPEQGDDYSVFGQSNRQASPAARGYGYFPSQPSPNSYANSQQAPTAIDRRNQQSDEQQSRGSLAGLMSGLSSVVFGSNAQSSSSSSGSNYSGSSQQNPNYASRVARGGGPTYISGGGGMLPFELLFQMLSGGSPGGPTVRLSTGRVVPLYNVPNDLTYNEYIELQEVVGSVKPPNQHASAEELSRLPTHSYKRAAPLAHAKLTTSTGQSMSASAAAAAARNNNEDDAPACNVCLEELQDGEEVTTLPCFHVFHTKCISKWLGEMNAKCPTCFTSVLDGLKEEEDAR